MATRGGAKAIGMADSLGALKVGSIAYRRGSFAIGITEAGHVRELAAEVEKMTGR